jgi:hypothetical protein
MRQKSHFNDLSSEEIVKGSRRATPRARNHALVGQRRALQGVAPTATAGPSPAMPPVHLVFPMFRGRQPVGNCVAVP